MLTLTRPNGESLQIITEDNKVIQIKITDVRGEQMRIAFNAPASHRIIKEELINFSAL